MQEFHFNKPLLLVRVAGCVALLAGMLASQFACTRSGASEPKAHQSQNVVTVGVVKAVRRNLSNDLEIASEFIPYQEIDVHAKVSGYIKKLDINWGTHVRQGQLLAVLEVPELNAQVLRDRATCQRSRQELAAAREELSRAESAYTVAHVTYGRLSGVQKTRPGLVAQEEVDVSYGKDMEAAAAVAGAKDALAAAQEELAVAQSTLEKDKDMVSYSNITAPFDGVVTKLDAYTGSLLPAGTSTSENALPLCHLSQNDLLRLVIPVPARIVPDIHIGERVGVRVASLNRVFQGKVARFSDEIDRATRTMHTEVQVPNSKYALVPGMYAYVQIPVKSAIDALALPVQAVQITQPGKGTVLAVNGQNRLVERHVHLGIETPNEVQILSGLQQGEQVVFGEQSRYRAGEMVKPELVNLASLEGGR